MRTIFIALRLFLLMMFLTGLAYPLFIMLVATISMPDKAGGSLIIQDEKVLGSALIGQGFTEDSYFWSRPSYNDYNPLSPLHGGALSQTSKELREWVDKKIKQFTVDPSQIPAELIYSSASGFSPHISLKAAYFQMDRVAKARNIQDIVRLKYFIDYVAADSQGDYVNVFLLNLALDENFPVQQT